MGETQKILIVDDDMKTVEILSMILRKAGYDVIYSLDAYQGVAKAHKEQPDLIILDLMMPAGGGMNALNSLKLSINTNQIPILVLTGIQDDSYREEAFDKGVKGYLEKPYDTDELLSVIDKIIG